MFISRLYIPRQTVSRFVEGFSLRSSWLSKICIYQLFYRSKMQSFVIYCRFHILSFLSSVCRDFTLCKSVFSHIAVALRMGAVLHEVRPYSGRGLRIGRGRDAHAHSALRNVGAAWSFPPLGTKGASRGFAEKGKMMRGKSWGNAGKQGETKIPQSRGACGTRIFNFLSVNLFCLQQKGSFLFVE